VRQREVWLDAAKGIGIVAVVFGHALPSRLVFLWHMPLFFFIAGYNFHKSETWLYIKKLTRRLLLPYVICLFTGYVLGKSFGVLSFLNLNVSDALYGGTRLKGAYAVFWFVTVLYCMLICMHLLSKIGLRWWMVCGLLAIGYLPKFFHVELPWNVQVVPLALAYGCLGCLLKNTIDSCLDKVRWPWLVIGVMLFVGLSVIPALSMDMKYNEFGVPVVSFLLSLICIMAVFMMAKFAEKVGWWWGLSRIGMASMVIMYTHMLFINVLSRAVGNKWLRFALVLLLSYAVYMLFQLVKYVWGRLNLTKIKNG
jgi:fucose 4-O-acetylase-like acetyltransferase